MIKIYSTFSEDNLYRDDNFIGKKDCGPAFYMENVFKNSDLKYNLFSNEKFKIKINITENGESGQIISKNIKTEKIKDFKKDDVIIISTIFDEWIIERSAKDNKIFLDIQGYVRALKMKDDFFEYSFWGDIYCLKGTEKEIKCLPSDIIEKQKRKMLIITNGSNGVVAYKNNKKYLFGCKKIKASDTVGAGDTFFAYFLQKYLLENDFESSVKYAIKNTEKFLLNKI